MPAFATRLMLGSWMLLSSSVKASGAEPDSLRARARKDAICSRVTKPSGQYRSDEQPVVMPSLNTHSMSDLKGLNLASTSGNAGIGCQSGFHSSS